MAKKMTTEITDDGLFNEIASIIELSKKTAVSQAKSTVTIMFWQVGRRVNTEILKNKRADYGKHIVAALAEKLSAKYGRNFELRNLRRMLQFAEQFPVKKIVSTLSTQLSWSHFIELLPLQTTDSKLFYAEEAINQGFDVRELRKHIEKKDFERKQMLIFKLQNHQMSRVIPSKTRIFLTFLASDQII
jgi:hypothetical protein